MTNFSAKRGAPNLVLYSLEHEHPPLIATVTRRHPDDMAERYISPRMPAAPHSAPSSIPTKLRAPIYNPYDKFPREEFDAWINNLTGRIRRVLAHEEPPTDLRAPIGGAVDPLVFDDEEALEDSFAAVKARRAAKGKERAEHPHDTDDEEYVQSIILPVNGEEYHEEGDEETSEEEADYGSEQPSEDEHQGVPQGFSEPIEISSDEDEAAVRSARPFVRRRSGESPERYSKEPTETVERSHSDLGNDDEPEFVNDEVEYGTLFPSNRYG